MPIKIKFDTANRPEAPTIVLSKRGGDKFGLIENVSEIQISDKMNSPSEFSFKVHKIFNGEECSLWNEITDFRLIYVGEWDKWFEITVNPEEDENSTLTKSISCTAMQESELGQFLIDEIEVNTEEDIARDDYKATVLHNKNDESSSLLHRLTRDKASNYVIKHVDETIAKLQRTFSFNSTSIYDAFMEISEEIHCIFVFGEASPLSNMGRTISVYDLESNCKDCGHRGEFTSVCPECGSINILEGYGEDTTIFVNTENLAESISFSTDTKAVKNCFKLKAGDDLMTSTVINSNPSGSPYIWYFNDETIHDMSDDLQSKLDTYNKKYQEYQNIYKAPLSTKVVQPYNTLIKKYKPIHEELEEVILPIVGYQQLAKTSYDTIDFYAYLKTTLMPSIEIKKTTATEQATLLSATAMSPISVKDASYISLATANSAVFSYAKVLVDTARYKVKINDSSIQNTLWSGSFLVESYSDDEDIATSATITIQFNDDYENFIRQQIDKALSKSEDKDFSIVGLFKLESSTFANELRFYGLSYLQIISDACQSCLDILVEQGISNEDTWKFNDNDLYRLLYAPFYEKKNLISKEISVRESELTIIGGTTDEYGDIKTKGLRQYIDDIRNAILKELDFKKCLGEQWEELCTFRRDDVWENDNYISDGLTNKELFKNANDFLQAAHKDIFKSATMQHSIESTLKDLLILDEFKSIRDYFKVGNWIRIGMDERVYKLRLLSYDIDYENLNKISVTFSDIIKVIDGVSDIESILSQSKSMTTSFTSVKRQAEQGEEGKHWLDNWVQKGLDATLTKIVNNADNQDVVFDSHGLLCRKYNQLTETYDPTQLKIINSTLAVTTDSWKTSRTGVGEFIFWNPKTQIYETGYGIIANQLVGNLVLSEELGVYNKAGNMSFDLNGLNITNGTNTFTVNPNDDSLLSIKNKGTNVFVVDSTGNLSLTGNITAQTLKLGTSGISESNGKNSLSIKPKDSSILTIKKGNENLLSFDTLGNMNVKGNITATSLTLGSDVKIDSSFLSGMDIYIQKNGVIGSNPSDGVTGTKISSNGLLQASNAIIYGTIYSSKGKIGGWDIGDGFLRNLDSNGKYVGLGLNNKTFAFYAGGTSSIGSDALFRVTHNGATFASNLTIENGGIVIKNKSNSSVMWVDSNGRLTTNTLLIYGNAGSLRVYGDGEQAVRIGSSGDYPAFAYFSNYTGAGRIGIYRNGTELYIEPVNKIVIRSINSTSTENTTANLDVVGDIHSNINYSLDAWKQYAKSVTSNNDNDIKLVWNGGRLEFWVDQKFIGSLPNGFNP